MPDLCFNTLDQLGAEAIAAARDAATAIEIDVLPNLAHPQRRAPKDIRDRLVPDHVFENATLTDLEDLFSGVECAILEGTTEETVHDASPENMSARVLTTQLRDRQSNELCVALPVLDHLRDLLQSIEDLRAARRLLGEPIIGQ